MGRIAKLDDQTIDRIAAGEVVERPSSVVKELVENCLDAGAQQLEIHLRGGGLEEITILDDGCGMPPEDMLLAVERHATSKIVSADDLWSIGTLGFRGEALPSIASVSRFTLRSRPHAAKMGYELKIDGGKAGSIETVATPAGTRIKVLDLFYNTPVRRTFLRSPASEGAQVYQTVVRLALSHPQVAFLLTSERGVLLQTQGTGRILDAFAAIYGIEMANQMIQVDRLGDGVHVRGLISLSTLSRSNRQAQSLFVNGRTVTHLAIRYSLEEAYHERLLKGRFPLYALFLQVDPLLVDVNVHPTKAEVRFSDERLIAGEVYRAVRDRLGEEVVVPSWSPSESEIAVANEPKSPPRPTGSSDSTEVHEEKTPFLAESIEVMQPKMQSAIEQAPNPLLIRDSEPASSTSLRFHSLGQAHRMYLLAEDDEALYLVDQHAAHERISFERLENGGTADVQELLLPIMIDVGAERRLLFETHQQEMVDAGFRIEAMGPGTLVVRGVPALLGADVQQKLMEELLDEFARSFGVEDVFTRRRRILREIAACKASVRANDRLDAEEMQALLDRLLQTKHPMNCPHGRPTYLKYPFSDIERRFDRR